MLRHRVTPLSMSIPCLVALLGIAAAACSPGGAPGQDSGGGGDVGSGGGIMAVPGLASVWAIHDGEKIERDDLGSPFKSGNHAWDGQKVKLFGGRNEILAFQIIVEADSAGIEGLSVALPALTRQGGAGAITYAPPGADPTEYTGRPIQIFVEHYMRVDEPSHASWVYVPGSPAAPADPTGWKPVQLVPENATPGRGGFPVDVAPQTNQAFWFEIDTGRDLPAGTYEGAVEVRAGGGVIRVPVELELFDFTLPDEGSMSAMLYFEPDQVELYQGQDLQDRYHRLAHRYRVELVHGYTPSSLAAARGRFDGSDFSPAAGYEGPGEGVGNRVAPASFYGVSDDYLDPASAHAEADAWMRARAAHAPGAITFLYMPDEPRLGDLSTILQISNNVKGSPGPGKDLPLFATTSWKSGLDEAIDIWCVLPEKFDGARAAQQRAAGRRHWYYNGSRPETGALVIDSPATDARVNLWAAFKERVDVYFYWHANHWRHNEQKVGERKQDVWRDPITFDNRGQPGKPIPYQGFINGDGVVLYPGQDVLHPDEDRGIAGPIATIQLANLRRGLQDHQYLTMARAFGLDAEVDAALAAVVPMVFSEAVSDVGFAEQGDAYEAVRYALAQAIAAATR